MMLARAATAGFSTDLWPPDEGAWRSVPTGVVTNYVVTGGATQRVVQIVRATGVTNVNVYANIVTYVATNAVGTNQVVTTNVYANLVPAVYFKEQTNQTFLSDVYVYTPTNMTLDVRERRGYEIWRAFCERGFYSSGGAIYTNIWDDEALPGLVSRKPYEFTVFRQGYIAEGDPGYSYRNLISAKYWLTVPESSYGIRSPTITDFADHSRNGGDYTGIATLPPAWTVSNILQHVGAPPNYFAWTPHRGLDGRPAWGREVTQTWTIAASVGTNVVSYTNTLFWGETNVISGTGGAVVVTVSTNANILVGRTSADYGWKYMERIVGSLQWLRGNGAIGSGEFWSGVAFSETTCPNDDQNANVGSWAQAIGSAEDPDTPQRYSGYDMDAYWDDYGNLGNWRRYTAGTHSSNVVDCGGDVGMFTTHRWEVEGRSTYSNNISGTWWSADYTNPVAVDVYALAGRIGTNATDYFDAYGSPFTSETSAVLFVSQPITNQSILVWSPDQTRPAPLDEPPPNFTRGYTVSWCRPILKPDFEYVWPLATSAQTVTRPVAAGASAIVVTYTLTGAPTRAYVTIAKPTGVGLNIQASPILSTATSRRMVVLLDGVTGAPGYRITVRVES